MKLQLPSDEDALTIRSGCGLIDSNRPRVALPVNRSKERDSCESLGRGGVISAAKIDSLAVDIDTENLRASEVQMT
jgi:hypothetical protein